MITPSLQHGSWKAELVYILARGFGIFVKTRDGFHTNTIWKAGTKTIVMHVHIQYLIYVPLPAARVKEWIIILVR